MSVSYQPVRRQDKLSVQVVDQIINMIVEGELEEGDRLPSERKLCETFEVSRTVIREAISVLNAKGLLESQTGSGTYIRALQSEDIADSLGLYFNTQDQQISLAQLLQVRRIFEPNIASQAAVNASQEDIGRLETVLSHMCDLVNDPGSFAKKDLDFHLNLARASGNPLFEILLEPLTDYMLQFIYFGSYTPVTTGEACEHHGEILNAIRDKDPKKAMNAMSRHLEQTERVTKEGLEMIQATELGFGED